MPHPLLHAAYSNADFGRELRKFRRERESSSLVFHINKNSIVIDRYAYTGGGAARVFVDIGKTFLYHSKNSGFQIAGPAKGAVGQVQIDEDSAALRKALDEGAQGREDAQLIEHGRV